MALVRAFRKEMGRSPNPGEMNMLKSKAKEMEQSDKIIPFPQGGKDKVDPFKERPNVTSDADELKPKMSETEAEMLLRMNRQNKEAVERLKKKKEKDLADKLKDFDGDPDALASGGVVALAEGGPPDPSKRKFMKILGGLASIPILGRFVTPVKQVAEVAPAAVEAVKGVPSYFFKLADKIRRLGEDAPGLTSVEREFGKKFKNYEMVENTDGEIVIKKNTEGGGMFGNEYETGIVQEEVMKILGGLASIPILGRFVTPVKQVAEVAPAAVEAVKGVPSYFFKLADKIRRLGEDAPGLTSVEREFGKKFKNYEMVENTDGEIVIKKNTEGGGMFGNEYETGIVQEEVMVYKPKKKTADGDLPEDYQEVTVKPDYEGKMKEVEDGLETVEDIIKEVGESRIKQAGGGIAYLLGE